MPIRSRRPPPATSAPTPTKTEQDELAAMELSNSELATVLDAMGMGAEGNLTDDAVGTAMGGGSLPHQAPLEAGFGTDLSGISASMGGQAGEALQSSGRAAATQGTDMGFAGNPTLAVAAHEVAHALLGHQGGDEASEEKEADAAAEAITAGESVDLGSSVQGTSGLAAYTIDRGWQVGSNAETATDGRQQLYATDARIDEANAKLEGAGKDGSFVRLTASGEDAEFRGKTVKKVEPEWVAKKDADGIHSKVSKVNEGNQPDTMGETAGAMALWSDCGRSSAAVTGSQKWGDRSGVYNKDGEQKTTKGKHDSTVSNWLKTEPGGFANAIYMDVLPSFIRKAQNKKYLHEGMHYTEKKYTGFTGWIRKLLGKPTVETKFIDPKTVFHAKEMYASMSDEGRDAFDTEAGINHHADPEIGQTYSMATEGDMPGFEEVKDDDGEAFTWNYHWAGVVMKDGTDNITLENYAVTAEYAKKMGVKQGEFVNRDWNFAMYGTEGEDQTFHKAHLDSGTHGTKATSIVAQADKK